MFANSRPKQVQDQQVMKFGARNNRQALSDITNSVAEDSKDIQPKKAQAFPTVVPIATGNVFDTSRSYMQRTCDDIDERDNDNPLLVTDYVNEMYEHFNDVEREFIVSHSYMSRQEFVNEKMRAILIDWLVEVHLKFKMVPESLYMTSNVIDRYLELRQVRRSKLQLVGVAALLIAAKYEEIYPPELRDLVHITDKAYTQQEILHMEVDIVNTLKYQFTVPNIHTFLCRYLKAAHADRTMVQLACFLTERSLQEYSMLRFPPSKIAASAVYVARKSLKRHPWSPTLVKYTNYDEDEIASCVDEMRDCFLDTSNQQQAVYRKYSSSKFGGVARMPIVYN